MDAIFSILTLVIGTVRILLIAWFILGLLFAFNVVGRNNEFLMAMYDSIARLFEPVLRPIRRILPDTGAIDFSPMVLLLLLMAVEIVMDQAAGAAF